MEGGGCDDGSGSGGGHGGGRKGDGSTMQILHSASMNQFILDEGSWQRCQRIVKVFSLHLSFIVQSNKSIQHKHSLRTGVLYQMPGYVSHPTLQTFRAIKALKVLSKLRIHFENQNFPTIIHIQPSQQVLSQCSQHKYIYKSCKFAWHVFSLLIIQSW